MGQKHTTDTSETTPDNDPPGAGSPELRAQIAALAEQVRRLRVREVPAASAAPVTGARDEPLVPGDDAPSIDVIAMAERAASEIREAARLAAERIRAERPAPTGDLAALLRRERATLALLAAETERIEQSVEALRSQVRALEAELAQLGEIVGATSRPAPFRVASGPDASRGTSPRPRG